jgi:hypothetical protein
VIWTIPFYISRGTATDWLFDSLYKVRFLGESIAQENYSGNTWTFDLSVRLSIIPMCISKKSFPLGKNFLLGKILPSI